MTAEDYMIPCLTKKFLGIDCFGCGMQRSFVMLLQGDFRGSFDLYPAIYPIILLLCFAVLSIFDKSRNYSKLLISLGILSALIIVISYFIKHPLPQW